MYLLRPVLNKGKGRSLQGKKSSG